MPDHQDVQKFIANLVANNKVMLFMKGNKTFPQCGFSAVVVEILKRHGVPFETFNVLSDPAVREGVKQYASWPTIPQLYINGEFIGGCDIVRELDANGELADKLKAATAAS
jgi:monothiol glutaredoxin